MREDDDGSGCRVVGMRGDVCCYVKVPNPSVHLLSPRLIRTRVNMREDGSRCRVVVGMR